MDPAALLLDAYGRIDHTAHAVLDGIDPAVLRWRPDPDANPVAWLVWHATRVQDDHLAALADRSQVWHADGWYERSGLSLDPDDTGYGHTAAQVAEVRIDDPDLLRGYLDAVSAASRELLASVTEDDLDRVVDRAYDPPVTMGVRLVSVLDDALQHLGQAAYLRGLAERAR